MPPFFSGLIAASRLSLSLSHPLFLYLILGFLSGPFNIVLMLEMGSTRGTKHARGRMSWNFAFIVNNLDIGFDIAVNKPWCIHEKRYCPKIATDRAVQNNYAKRGRKTTPLRMSEYFETSDTNSPLQYRLFTGFLRQHLGVKIWFRRTRERSLWALERT